MIKKIDSIKDEKIILAREVKTRKGRGRHKRMLLEGEQILDWGLEHGIEVEYILFTENAQATVEKKYLKLDIEAFHVSDGIQKKATEKNYVIPIVGLGKIPEKTGPFNADFAVVLDEVKDYGNIGTIIRTCHAFGIHDVLSTSHETDLYQTKTIEASRGSVFSTDIVRFKNSKDTIRHLREKGYQIIVTSPGGNSLQSLAELKPEPVALVIGNESTGVSQDFEEKADILIRIPMSESIESLNAGVAAGISVYELKLKQVMTMIEQQIKSTLGRELNVAGMLVQKALDAELKKISDLSSRQVIFMMVLRCDREMTVEEMCRQFGILDNEANDFLDILIKKGLIQQDEKLQLTDRGEEILGKLWFTVESTEQKILSGFSEAEVNTLKKQLHQIQANCIQITQGT
ncbi:MAG: TrmH family RNA methyltransferase [Desulfobacteraceae bacterium]|jgi:TrmH family RNA methyltransferase